MSEDFVRDVLREHAEADMPADKDPWPAIRDRVQASYSAQKAASSPRPTASEASQPGLARTTPQRGISRYRVSTAMAMIGLLALAVGSIAFLAGIGRTQPGSESTLQGCWGIITSPNVEDGDTVLSALSTNSADDVWAAGYSSSSGVAQTLVQRWNGQEWTTIPSANVPARNNYLTGVAALAVDNVWAVGYHCTGDCITDVVPLIEHWDGAKWSIIPVAGSGRLNGITAVTANDIWTVGKYERQSIALHWDGQQWVEVDTNDPPLEKSSIELRAAVAISSTDVWAVGEEYDSVANSYKGVTYHWDGIRWSNISDRADQGRDRLYAVSASSANDIWAVGDRGNSALSAEHLQTATKQWEGTRWLDVPSPNIGTGDSYLRGVAAISPTDVWAVGGYGPRTGTKQTLILHWDGVAWSVVPSPNVEGQSNRFFGVEALSASEIWAVGTYNKTGTGAFIERFYDPCTITRPILSVPIIPDIKDPTAIPGFDGERPLP